MQICLYLSNRRDIFSSIDTCSIAPLIHTELNLSVYYSRLDWHSESERERESERGWNKSEKVKSMERMREERRDTSGHSVRNGSVEAGSGMEAAQVLTWRREERGGLQGRGCSFSYSCSVGKRASKRDSKTTAAGARPGRHERGEWWSRNRGACQEEGSGEVMGATRGNTRRGRGGGRKERIWRWRYLTWAEFRHQPGRF